MATLSETIKNIAEGKVVTEEIGSAEANKATLHPGSKFKEAMPKTPAAVVDIGKAPTTILKGEQNPDATKSVAKDKSKSSKAATAGETAPKKLKEEEDTSVEQENVVVEETTDDEIITEDDLNAFALQMQEEGHSDQEIQEAIDTILEDYEEVITEEKVSEDEQPVVDATPVMDLDIDLSEDMKALFQGETITEEFQNKSKLIFETVIREKLTSYQAQLDEAFENNLVEAVADLEEAFSEKIEKYLDYVVEQWMEENAVAVESSLRTEITEDFIQGFKNLCIEHNIDLPEEKVDIVEQLSQQVAELETKLNEEIATNVALREEITSARLTEIFLEQTDGLADTQVEKLRSLAEAVEFTTEEDFINSVKTLRENYFPQNGKVNDALNTVDNVEGSGVLNETISPNMDRYLKAMGRTLPS